MNRIVIIAPHFPEYSLRLANALSYHAPTALLIETPKLDAEFSGRIRPNSDTLAIHKINFSSILSVCSIIAFLVKFKPSVVHIQEPSGFLKAVICAVTATIARPFAQIALTVHDPLPHDGRDHKIVQRMGWLRWYIRHLANLVFVHGNYCHEQYTRTNAVPRQRVVETAHGVILAGEDKTISPSAPFRILSFGRMEAYKGVEVLCSAAELLHQAGVDFTLNVSGRGPELDRLEGRLTQLPEVNVNNQFIDSAALIQLIMQSDCVVLPYLSATQSGVLAAAFANGRFVVASRVGGIPDLVQDMVNGLLVPPNDPRALAGALRLTASDRALRAKLDDGAALTASTLLSWQNIARGVVTAYQANH